MDEFLGIMKNKLQSDETGSKSILMEKFENNLKFIALESKRFSKLKIIFQLIHKHFYSLFSDEYRGIR